MKWFIPSWSGDFRVEDDPNHTETSILKIHEPTLAELGALQKLGEYFKKRGWVPVASLWDPEGDQKKQRVYIGAPISKVGAAVAKVLKTGKQTLTAVKFSGGRVETVEGTDASLDQFAEQKIEPAKAQSEKPEAAATVKRPTPSCPQCHAGAIEPATEVLLSFLTEEQHEQWAHSRSLVCHGGRTGYPYLLAHRHSPAAKRMGHICCDLRKGVVVHFHDFGVPPEEEVLAAMLCLQHREHWLRNEATMLTRINPRDGRPPGYTSAFTGDYFKNPFGDISDGTEDTVLTSFIGGFFLGMQGKIPN
jgi:hypothetical protein